MATKISSLILLTLPLALIGNAASCGGGGSLIVSDVSASLNSMVLGPQSQHLYPQGTAQICIVNRAPNTPVSLDQNQVNDAIKTVLDVCCTGEYRCSGGQQQIPATTGNVIDLSVQGLGEDCTV